MGHLVTSPNLRVNFFTQVGTLSVSAQFPNTENADNLISVQTHKDLRQAAGTFVITLTAAPLSDFSKSVAIHRAPTDSESQAGIEGVTDIHGSRDGFGWKDVLHPGDLVVIEMGPDRPQPTDTYYARNFATGIGGSTEVVMVGSIDDITSIMQIGGDGKPTRQIIVSGRDFGKFLVDDQIIRDPWWNPIDALLGFRSGLLAGGVKEEAFPRAGVLGLPANIMRLVFDLWIFDKFNVEFDLNSPGTKLPQNVRRLSDILRYSLDAETPVVPYLSSWIDFEGSPWAMFQEIIGNPWYILHLDTRREQDVQALLNYTGHTIDNTVPVRVPEAPQGTVRWNTATSRWNHQVFLTYYRNPASNRFYDDFTVLPTRVITPDDVISEELSVSLEEVFTRWRALAIAPDLTAEKRVLTTEVERALDLEKRFGFRPRIINAPFLHDMQNAFGLNLSIKLTKQIRDWDILNLSMLSGSYTIKGMAQARVGDRLHYRTGGDTRGVDYFIEGVTQEFRAFQGWTTNLAVTRGQTHREKGEPLFDGSGNVAFGDHSAMHRIGK